MGWYRPYYFWVFFGALFKATYRASCIVTVNFCQSQSVSHSLIQSRTFFDSFRYSQSVFGSLCLSWSFWLLFCFGLFQITKEFCRTCKPTGWFSNCSHMKSSKCQPVRERCKKNEKKHQWWSYVCMCSRKMWSDGFSSFFPTVVSIDNFPP